MWKLTCHGMETLRSLDRQELLFKARMSLKMDRTPSCTTHYLYSIELSINEEKLLWYSRYLEVVASLLGGLPRTSCESKEVFIWGTGLEAEFLIRMNVFWNFSYKMPPIMLRMLVWFKMTHLLSRLRRWVVKKINTFILLFTVSISQEEINVCSTEFWYQPA
jgi:hypothetical protein